MSSGINVTMNFISNKVMDDGVIRDITCPYTFTNLFDFRAAGGPNFKKAPYHQIDGTSLGDVIQTLYVKQIRILEEMKKRGVEISDPSLIGERVVLFKEYLSKISSEESDRFVKMIETAYDENEDSSAIMEGTREIFFQNWRSQAEKLSLKCSGFSRLLVDAKVVISISIFNGNNSGEGLRIKLEIPHTEDVTTFQRKMEKICQKSWDQLVIAFSEMARSIATEMFTNDRYTFYKSRDSRPYLAEFQMLEYALLSRENGPRRPEFESMCATTWGLFQEIRQELVKKYGEQKPDLSIPFIPSIRVPSMSYNSESFSTPGAEPPRQLASSFPYNHYYNPLDDKNTPQPRTTDFREIQEQILRILRRLHIDNFMKTFFSNMEAEFRSSDKKGFDRLQEALDKSMARFTDFVVAQYKKDNDLRGSVL